MATALPTAAPRFLFVDEVAAVLRRSEASVRWLIQTNQLKSARLAGRRVVKPEWLDEFIDGALDAAS